MLRNYGLLAALAAVALVACGSESAPAPAPKAEQADEHAHHGKHDGMVTVIGDHVAHIEVVHDVMDGIVTIWIYDADMKDLEPDAAPVLNAKLHEGTVKLTGEKKDGAWHFKHLEFEGGHPSGRFLLKLGGKTYTPEFLHDH